MELPLQQHISNRSTKQREFLSSVVEFTDGYSQRITRGPESARQMDKWTVTYEGVTSAMADELIAFFDTVQSHKTFTATMPKDTVQKNWRIDGGYVHTTKSDNFHTFTFVMVQELR